MLTRDSIRKASRLQFQVETSQTGTFFGARVGSGSDCSNSQSGLANSPFFNCPVGLVARVVEKKHEKYCRGNIIRKVDEESVHEICLTCEHYYQNKK